MLPTTSIHSFKKLIKELNEAFGRYYYKYVYKWFNQLRMKFNELSVDFVDLFIHLCYEFFEEDIDWDFMNEKFQHLVQISLKQFES